MIILEDIGPTVTGGKDGRQICDYLPKVHFTYLLYSVGLDPNGPCVGILREGDAGRFMRSKGDESYYVRLWKERSWWVEGGKWALITVRNTSPLRYWPWRKEMLPGKKAF